MAVRGALCVSALVLFALPAVSAEPLDVVNAPLCSTVWSYFCAHPLGVPESPEEAIVAAQDAVAPFQDAVNGPLCTEVWSYFCAHPLGVPQNPEDAADAVGDATQPFLDLVNGPLCATVWSYFCANPVAAPI